MSIYYGITLCDRHRDIDLKKLKEYGFKIAYIEVTNGYTVSELLYDHYENAKRSGLKIGYIHTLDCKAKPLGQADFFFGALRGLECNVRIATNALCCSMSSLEKCFSFNRYISDISGVNTISMVRSRCARAVKTPVWLPSSQEPAINVNYIAKQKPGVPLRDICEELVEVSTFTEDILIPSVCILKNAGRKYSK